MSPPRFIDRKALVNDLSRYARTWKARDVAERLYQDAIKGLPEPEPEHIIRRQRLFAEQMKAREAHCKSCEILADTLSSGVGFDPDSTPASEIDALLDASNLSFRRSA